MAANVALPMVLIPALLATLLAAGAPAQTVDTERTLRVQCERYAANPSIPWALAHGIVAFGKDFRASDGRLAIDVMVDDYVHVEKAEGKLRLSFSEYQGQRPVEPHRNLLVKTMVVAGVPMSHKFKEVTLQQLFEGVETRFSYAPASDEFWATGGWTLDAIGMWLSPAHATFKNGEGQTIDWNRVIADGFSHLEKIDGFIEEAMKQKRPFVEKRKQGIYAQTCGGFHLIQPLMLWLRFPEARAFLQSQFDREMKVLLYRLHSERQVYEDAIQKAPQYRLLVLVQELKFFGHWLETMGRLTEAGVFKPDAEQRRQIDEARTLLSATVARLAAEKAFDSMDAIEKSGYQTYLDLIGDSCHAFNGWRLTSPKSP